MHTFSIIIPFYYMHLLLYKPLLILRISCRKLQYGKNRASRQLYSETQETKKMLCCEAEHLCMIGISLLRCHRQREMYCSTIVPILKRTIINILLGVINGVILADIISYIFSQLPKPIGTIEWE